MTLMKRPERLLLFDIDGTLVNVRPGLSKQVFLDTLAALHALESVALAEGYSFHGRTDRSIYVDVCRYNGVRDDDLVRHEGVFVERLVEGWRSTLDAGSVSVLPGVPELLDLLDQRDTELLSLLTGNVAEGAIAKLDPHGLAGRFTGGAFGSDSPDRNELPAVALDRIEELTGHRFEPERGVIIGDSPRDIECARAGGLHVIAVATGGSDVEELADHSPDLLVDSLEQHDRIIKFLERIP